MCMCGYVGCGAVKATPKLPSTFDLQVNIAMIIALLIIILITAAITLEIRWPDVYLICRLIVSEDVTTLPVTCLQPFYISQLRFHHDSRHHHLDHHHIIM